MKLPVDGVALEVMQINVLQLGSLALTFYRPVEHTATLRDRRGGKYDLSFIQANLENNMPAQAVRYSVSVPTASSYLSWMQSKKAERDAVGI